MQYLGLVLLVFGFVCFFLAATNSGAPHWNKLVAAGLAFITAATIFGGVETVFHLSH